MLSFDAQRGKRLLHWIVGGGRRSDVRRFILGDELNEVEGAPKLTGKRVVHGFAVELYRYPPFPAGGPNGGHVAAAVSVAGQVVFASVHGYSHGDAAIAMAVDMASQLR